MPDYVPKFEILKSHDKVTFRVEYTMALTFENLLQQVRDITRLVVTYREQVFFGGGGSEVAADMMRFL